MLNLKKYIVYLLKNLLKPFFLSLFSITAIIWITRSIRYLDYITEYGVSFSIFLRLIVMVLPSLIVIIIPISLIITNITTYSKLIKNNEIIILQNSGVEKSTLLFPAFLLSMLSFVFIIYSTFFLIPKAERQFEEIKEYIKNDISTILLNKNGFNTFKNITLYSKDKDDKVLNSLLIYINDLENGKANIINARQGIIENNILKLIDGNIQENKFNKKDKQQIIFFDEYNINLAQYFNKNKSNDGEKDISSLNINDLFNLDMKGKNKKEIMEYYAELNKRFLNAFIVLTIGLISTFIVLNSPFNRSINALSNISSFCISTFIFGFTLYSIRMAEKAIFGIYLGWCLAIIPIIYLMFNLKEKKYVR